MNWPGRTKTAHLPLIEGGPPRLRIAWRIDLIGAMRDVVVMVDGEICQADPIAPRADATWVHRVPDVGTIIVTRPVRAIFRSVPNITFNGMLLPGTAFAPDLLDRASMACAAVLTAELLYCGVAQLSQNLPPAAPPSSIALHAAIGATTAYFARLGGWGVRLAVIGTVAGPVAFTVSPWALHANEFRLTMALAHVVLAFVLLDLMGTRRRP